MDNRRTVGGIGAASEKFLVFILGACAYLSAELLYRGYSHITMFFAGGLCFLLIYMCEKKLYFLKTVYRCVIYAFMITAVEFVFGVVFNMMLDMKVWDYSEEPFNILGQVCPGFVFVWFILSFPAIFICRRLSFFFDRLRQKHRDNALDK